MILEKQGRKRCGLDSSSSGQGPVAGSCEHINAPSCSIKAGKFWTS
jgi:hypothetical protein